MEPGFTHLFIFLKVPHSSVDSVCPYPSAQEEHTVLYMCSQRIGLKNGASQCCGSRMFIPDPDPRSWFFTHPESRTMGQKGTGSRFRIRNTGATLGRKNSLGSRIFWRSHPSLEFCSRICHFDEDQEQDYIFSVSTSYCEYCVNISLVSILYGGDKHIHGSNNIWKRRIRANP